jgi:hypothetical protein
VEWGWGPLRIDEETGYLISDLRQVMTIDSVHCYARDDSVGREDSKKINPLRVIKKKDPNSNKSKFGSLCNRFS